MTDRTGVNWTQRFALSAAATPSEKGVVRHRERLEAVLRYDIDAAGTRLIVECPYCVGEPAYGEGDRVALSLRCGGGVPPPP